MLTLILLGIAFTIACITSTSPFYLSLAFSAILVTYLFLLDKEY